MKSQKENLVLFFLFLTVLVQQKKLERGIIERLREEIHHKIEKYISNSNKKMSLEA
jgi:septum formation topological specificity factor MinE